MWFCPVRDDQVARRHQISEAASRGTNEIVVFQLPQCAIVRLLSLTSGLK